MNQVNPATAPNLAQQVAQPQAAALSSTDQKVYALVILRNLLVAAAILLGAFSFVWACLVNPVWVLGIIASIGLGTLGLLIDTTELPATSSWFNIPFVPNQPLGLWNSGASCWINSAFQLFANLPNATELAEQHRRGKVQGGDLTPLQTALETYTSEHKANLEGKAQNRVSSAKIIDLWTWLYEITNSATIPDPPIDGPGGTKQQDPIEFFREILFPLPIHYEVQTLANDGDVVETLDRSNEFWQYITLDLQNSTSFKEIFASYFSDEFTTDDVANPVRKRRVKAFTSAPEGLFIHLERYKQVPVSQMPFQITFFQIPSLQPKKSSFATTKITNPIEVPRSLTIDVKGQPAAYRCDGFIVHLGGISGGHYISYLFKHGSWWCVNDHRSYQVTEAYIANQMPHGYIYHFAKESPQQP